MLRRIWRFRRWVAGCLLLGVGLGWTGGHYWFRNHWPRLLVVERPFKRADAIVVLGGESSSRPERAAQLYHEGVAMKVIVLGHGDSSFNREQLIEMGVREEVIQIETESRSTLENATALAGLNSTQNFHKILLVTSRFHTRRALATFRKTIPDIEFGIVGTTHPWHRTKPGKHGELKAAERELTKVLGYWIVHGISPILRNSDP